MSASNWSTPLTHPSALVNDADIASVLATRSAEESILGTLLRLKVLFLKLLLPFFARVAAPASSWARSTPSGWRWEGAACRTVVRRASASKGRERQPSMPHSM